MAVARVTEISSTSDVSSEDALVKVFPEQSRRFTMLRG